MLKSTLLSLFFADLYFYYDTKINYSFSYSYYGYAFSTEGSSS